MVACRSPLATTRTGGPPIRPRCSTSQPASASTAWRAAARETVLAAWAPVTKPNDAPVGRPNSSFSHPPVTSSTTAAAGEVTALKAGWSHAVVSTSAAVAASRAPPTTNPKYRGPVVATRAGSTAPASSSIVASADVGSSRNEPRADRTASASKSVGKTGRSAGCSRKSAARSAVWSRSSRRVLTPHHRRIGPRRRNAPDMKVAPSLESEGATCPSRVTARRRRLGRSSCGPWPPRERCSCGRRTEPPCRRGTCPRRRRPGPRGRGCRC